jgi:uncharacterized membrane protein
MRDLVVKLVVAGAVMGVLDALWIGVVANRFYKDNLGPLLLDKPNMIAALSFYVVYVFGVVLFAIIPAESVGSAAVYGAALGFVAYATYDLTNLATLKGFPLRVVVVDMLWGTLLTATVAATTSWIADRV